VLLSDFRPAAPVQIRDPFDHPDFLFELKQDGFRALAHVTPRDCQLVSRRGNVYKSFRDLSDSLRSLDYEAVLDGEIVILDKTGRPQFYDLLRRHGEPVFYAFDCLMLNGRDLRSLPLLERKEILRGIVNDHPRILVARHVERNGCDLFRLVCEQDLEGIVAKRKNGAYGEDWFKIRNPGYTQYQGRRELFERRVMVAIA
jgi:bifunctional non-homologous end joining protein LigD